MTEVPIINQTISAVAPVLHRDTINPTIPATQDAFVNSAEAFFDKISDTTVNELNQVTTKIDATVSAINIVSNEISTAAIDVEDAKQITIDAKEATIIAKNEAQSIYDNFDDRYLGTKSTPPTVDNDGDPLKQGALYCRESINPEENGLMYVYDILLGDWVNITFVPTLLSSLTDVFFSGLANGDILKYDISIGKWKNIPADYYAKTETYAKTEINSKLSQLFIKPKSRSRLPLFIKQTPYSIYIPSGTKIEVSNSILEINSNITISLNSNLLTPEVKTAGTDYYVYAKSDSTFYISGNNEIITDRLLGGFHYGLTAEAESISGTKTEADMVKIRGINEYSLWDLKYYAKCYAGNKGMFSDGIYCYDIYLGGVDYGINLYSKANVQIAGGGLDAPYNREYPKIPLIYGGNGTINYGKLTPFVAYDLVNAAGKELIGYTEFTKVAYGVQEGLSQAEPISGQTGHIGALTSKYGMELATGSQYIWSRDFGTSAAGSWSAIADNRGQVYTNVQVAILGGSRAETAGISGSRCSNWYYGLTVSDGSHGLTDSFWGSGFRARCDLMILD